MFNNRLLKTTQMHGIRAMLLQISHLAILYLR